jgi:hypothetical protein
MLSTDSAADIAAKYKAWSTDAGAFSLNPMLGPVLRDILSP